MAVALSALLKMSAGTRLAVCLGWLTWLGHLRPCMFGAAPKARRGGRVSGSGTSSCGAVPRPGAVAKAW